MDPWMGDGGGALLGVERRGRRVARGIATRETLSRRRGRGIFVGSMGRAVREVHCHGRWGKSWRSRSGTTYGLYVLLVMLKKLLLGETRKS